MVEKAVIVGAGGHCRVILSVLKHFKNYQVIGVADRDASTFGEVIGENYINCTWEDLNNLHEKGVSAAFIAVGENELRSQLFRKMKNRHSK